MKASSDFPSLNVRRPDGLSPEGVPYNILIVDDSIFVKKQLAQILTSENFNVIDMAGDGEEAVEKYKEHHPKIDLVTMDITMPKMDGISALEKIIEFDKNAKVVMISALGKQELVKKSLLLGAKNYIIKPLDRKKVLERITTVIKRFS
jgi:two-component system, chemotaxis family, chemotaxis protein CheY